MSAGPPRAQSISTAAPGRTELFQDGDQVSRAGAEGCPAGDAPARARRRAPARRPDGRNAKWLSTCTSVAEGSAARATSAGYARIEQQLVAGAHEAPAACARGRAGGRRPLRSARTASRRRRARRRRAPQCAAFDVRRTAACRRGPRQGACRAGRASTRNASVLARARRILRRDLAPDRGRRRWWLAAVRRIAST